MNGNISDEFMQNTESGNLTAVRITLKNYLMIREFDGFDASLAYARSRMTGLVQPHNGGSFISDETKWNNDYLTGLCIDLIDNFSDERIRHIKSVVKKIMSDRQSERIGQIDYGDAEIRRRSANRYDRRVISEVEIHDEYERGNSDADSTPWLRICIAVAVILLLVIAGYKAYILFRGTEKQSRTEEQAQYGSPVNDEPSAPPNIDNTDAPQQINTDPSDAPRPKELSPDHQPADDESSAPMLVDSDDPHQQDDVISNNNRHTEIETRHDEK